MDMSAIIVPKSDQINADDLQGGRTVTVSVAKVAIRGGQEQPISIHLNETDKVYRPCKSMCRVLAQAWGLDSAKYVGKSMTLYTDPSVKFGPLAVGGIRISHMSHIDGPMVMALTATKGVKKSFKVLPLEVSGQGAGETVFTVEQAEADLRNAATLDDLKNAWSRKIMAPHRDALKGVLDECKQALAEPEQGRDDSQRGESHNGTDDTDAFGLKPITVDPAHRRLADIMIGALGKATGDADAVAEVMDAQREAMKAWPDDLKREVYKAQDVALGRGDA